MYPEDRVLVAIMTSPADLALARDEGWYRIPQERVPKGVVAEYLAFYLGRAFGDQKWAIHYYARKQGHELVRRRDLFPDELDHPRADDVYFKIQLGPLQQLPRPILSLRWRRITFIHTTWDRFVDASEINDLFVEGAPYVDRLYYALREAGILPERRYRIREGDTQYLADIAVPCEQGTVGIVIGDKDGPPPALCLRPDQVAADLTECVSQIVAKIGDHGGVRLPGLRSHEG
jgi:hypothetical protein